MPYAFAHVSSLVTMNDASEVGIMSPFGEEGLRAESPARVHITCRGQSQDVDWGLGLFTITSVYCFREVRFQTHERIVKMSKTCPSCTDRIYKILSHLFSDANVNIPALRPASCFLFLSINGSSSLLCEQIDFNCSA